MNISPERLKNGYRRRAFFDVWMKDPQQRRRPKCKDEEVYVEVRVKNRSLREVGRQFGISHTQVLRQVVRYQKWLGNTVGRGNTGDWKQRKGVAEYTHRQRLELFLSQAWEGLERSCQDVMTRKFKMVEGKPQFTDGQIRQTLGNWRWLELALRTERMRMEFECGSGAVEPPSAEEVTDEENKIAVRRHFENAYFDQRPTEQELEDARTVHSRLENERKLVEEERRSLMIERGEVAKLKREMERVIEEAKKNAVGRVSLPVESSPGGTTSTSAAANTDAAKKERGNEDSTGKETRPTESKEKPRPQFSWHYATAEDFLYSTQRRRSEQHLREMERQKKFCPPFSNGPPLEVEPNVYIVPWPYPGGDEAKKRYLEEYRRQQAEGRAAGKWREPREKFKYDGYRMARIKE